MQTSLVVKNTGYTLPTQGIVPSAMFGGTPANVVAPTLTVVETAVKPGTFVIDPTETFMYYVGNTGLFQMVLATAVSNLLASVAAMGSSTTTPSDMQLSADGTKVILVTKINTIITVLIAAPHTVTVVVGVANTPGITDGIGTDARITASNVGIFLPQSFNPSVLYFMDNTSLRMIGLSNWNVTTIGGYSNQFGWFMSFGQVIYYGQSGTLNRVALIAGSNNGSLVSNIPGVSTGNWGWIPDVRKPAERCIYGFGASTTAVWRFDLVTGSWTNIATLPGNLVTVLGRPLGWIGSHLYVSTTAGLVMIS